MPLLQVRDIPEELYDELTRVAKQDNRSIAQETIVLLKSALKLNNTRTQHRLGVFREIQALNIDSDDTFPDPAELIREDRDR